MRRRPGFVVALVLLSLGVVLLLRNVGILQIGLVDLLQLWPLLLILLAIEMLASRAESDLAYGLGIFWAVVVIVVGLALAWQTTRFRRPEAVMALPQSSSASEPVSDATEAEVSMSLGTGLLALGPTSAGDVLAAARGFGHDAELAVGRSGRTPALVSITSSVGGGDVLEPLRRMRGGVRWEVDLSTALPLVLQLGQGGGEARIDLTGLQVERVDLALGVGHLALVLPDAGESDVQVRMTAGTVEVDVPDGVAASITIPPRLTTVDVGPGFVAGGTGRVETPDLSPSAPHHEVRIDLAAGRVRVR